MINDSVLSWTHILVVLTDIFFFFCHKRIVWALNSDFIQLSKANKVIPALRPVNQILLLCLQSLLNKRLQKKWKVTEILTFLLYRTQMCLWSAHCCGKASSVEWQLSDVLILVWFLKTLVWHLWFVFRFCLSFGCSENMSTAVCDVKSHVLVCVNNNFSTK